MRCRAASVPAADLLLLLYVQLPWGLDSSCCLAAMSCSHFLTDGWSVAGAPGKQMSSRGKGASAEGLVHGSSCHESGSSSTIGRTLKVQAQAPSSAMCGHVAEGKWHGEQEGAKSLGLYVKPTKAAVHVGICTQKCIRTAGQASCGVLGTFQYGRCQCRPEQGTSRGQLTSRVLLPVHADNLCIIVLLLIPVCPLEQHHHVCPRLQLATLTVQHRPAGQHKGPSTPQQDGGSLLARVRNRCSTSLHTAG